MLRRTNTLKLLKTIEGSYRPRQEEIFELAELARMNKLYLAYLRAIGDVLRDELLREKARFRWFMGNVTEVVEALNGLSYALYKFRKPVDHVSVDLDILSDRRDVPRAVRLLRDRGFRVISPEPYTVTLARRGFIVDLYTQPSFAWVVYLDGKKLLRDYVEGIEVNGVPARGLTREAEVVVAAAHAICKEHIVLLIDCLLAWSWMNENVWSIATELGAERALKELLRVCSLVKSGGAEAPYRLELHTVAKMFLDKVLHDPAFRVTVTNVLKYVFLMQGSGKRILWRMTSRSY